MMASSASWGCCVSLFDSSEEPNVRPEETLPDVPCGFGREFVMGRATFNDEVFSASKNSPTETPSSL